MMKNTNLGYLSWNPLNWFKERPAAVDTAVIRTPAGETITVPIYAPTPAELPSYIPADITAPQYRAPADGNTGSWWDPFLTTVERVVGTWTNYQQAKSQSARDMQALQMQYDLAMAQAEAAKALPVVPPPVKPPIPRDWAAIAKTALLVGGIGLGIWLIVKKKK